MKHGGAIEYSTMLCSLLRPRITQTLHSQLCNPTVAPFELRQLDVDALLQNGKFLEGSLRDSVLVQPASVKTMVLDYVVVKDWQPLLATGLGVVFGSALSNIITSHRSTMQAGLQVNR